MLCAVRPNRFIFTEDFCESPKVFSELLGESPNFFSFTPNFLTELFTLLATSSTGILPFSPQFKL